MVIGRGYYKFLSKIRAKNHLFVTMCIIAKTNITIRLYSEIMLKFGIDDFTDSFRGEYTITAPIISSRTIQSHIIGLITVPIYALVANVLMISTRPHVMLRYPAINMSNSESFIIPRYINIIVTSATIGPNVALKLNPFLFIEHVLYMNVYKYYVIEQCLDAVICNDIAWWVVSISRNGRMLG